MSYSSESMVTHAMEDEDHEREDERNVVDKRDDSLIIDSECKRIMRNLCSLPTRSAEAFSTEHVGLTQPTFLSGEDSVLFFKTKMFYLLQERHCFLRQSNSTQARSSTASMQAAPAEAYAPFLSPFCESAFEFEEPVRQKKLRLRCSVALLRDAQEGGSKIAAAHPFSKARRRLVQDEQKTGLAKFLENIRKAETSVLHMLEEKMLKTIEGTGYAVLLGDTDVRKADVILNLFPDYNELQQHGKDEETKLNNLVNHVRTRLKHFDKLQSFYENHQEDHTAHVFTVPNLDVVDCREELAVLKQKRLHQIDEKKLQMLYKTFRDDYGAAKTTLIADGTQPVVLNRKKLDRVKKYVDDCADWQGKMLLPYVKETNFFFLMFPWIRAQDFPKKAESDVTLSSEYSL